MADDQKTTEKTIAAIVDDPAFKAALENAACLCDGQVLFYDSAESLRAALRTVHNDNNITAVLSTLPLPDMKWSAFYDDIKAHVPTMPVMVICKSDEADDHGLSSRDVFTMPVRLGEVLSRLNKYLKGEAIAWIQDEITFGPYCFLPDQGVLTRTDKKKSKSEHLTEKERDILITLYGQRGGVVDRSDLLGAIWGYKQNVETHTLETHIYRLRQKIEDDPANPQYLLTDGSGYKLAV